MSVAKELCELVEAYLTNESALAAYYGACMEKFPENRERWERLKKEEEFHAEVFMKIRRSIEESPTRWRLGKFQAQTVRLICSSVKEKTLELRQGKMNPTYAVNFIVDVEQSLIESNLARALETDDQEFQQLLLRVQEDTVGHKQTLLQMRK